MKTLHSTLVFLSSAVCALVLTACGSHSSSGFLPDAGPGGSGTGGTCSGSNCATGGTGGASQACVSAADCASRTDGKTSCDIASGACVECVIATDCPTVGDTCVSGTCQAGRTCTNSLDCTGGQVCDTVEQRCVECISSLECTGTQACVGNVCRQGCSSNSECVRTGQLCNLSLGACVDCVLSSDCDRTQYCNQGTCAPDACVANASTCDAAGTSIVTCNSDGSGTLTPVVCPTGQFCVRGGTTGVSCAARLCAPSTTGCDATAEHVTQCSADGFSQDVVDDCSAKNQVCVSGVCKSVVCPPSALFCSGQEVRRCSTNGDTSTLVQTCGTGLFCNPSLAACASQLCTPNGPACNAEIATTCNGTGSGYVTGGIDCASSALHCWQGECKDQVCSPSTLLCANGSIQLCNSTGTGFTLYQSCTTGQYCDAATISCKPQICSPSQPTCSGNSTATCNTDGSGYSNIGSSCGTQYCVSGTCQNALFAENFEDGDFTGWTIGATSGYSRNVVTGGANSTGYAFTQTTTNYLTQTSGVYRTFSNLKPTHISWWGKTDTSSGYTGAFLLTSSVSTSYYVAYVEFYYGYIYNWASTGYYITYTTGTWYHMEMRNIAWTAHTYDWYINDALIHAAMPFYTSSATDIARLDLYNYYPGTAYWDEITFQ